MGFRLRGLQFPPTPEFAASHAQLAVDAARDVARVILDIRRRVWRTSTASWAVSMPRV